MCGILGFTSNRPVQPEHFQAFKKMFVECQTRGRDASGVAWLDETENLRYYKDACKSSDLVERDDFKMLEANPPRTLIAHCRLKTQGTEKNNFNNHPVMDEKLGWALVHNGTIWNDDAVFKQFKLKREGQVDTEAILKLFGHYISKDVKMKPSKAIKKTVEHLSGAATFALIGEEYPHSLYLFKGSNPLSLAYIKEWGMVFFASTEEILKAGLCSTELEADGFFKRRVNIVNYYPGIKVAEDTVLVVRFVGDEIKVHVVEAEMSSKAESKGSIRYVRTDGGQMEIEDEHDLRHRIGDGKHSLGPGGTVERKTSYWSKKED